VIDPATIEIDAGTRAAVIDGVLSRLRAAYVFPAVAERMEEEVRRRMKAGDYDTVTTASSLCDILTAHLWDIGHDKHLRVFYSREPRTVHPVRADAIPDPDERERLRRSAAARNFGVERVERLAGNIGLLELRVFVSPELPGAGATAVAAMTVLAHTDALIVDLRRNEGGSPAMIALISSYLFDRRTHLNDLYWREGDRTEQFWTHHVPGLQGPGDPHKPVYVLTSKDTFSGGEEFAYNLKALQRATLIGETTAGGAHPGRSHMVTAHVGVVIPAGRAINPITGTNWEGTGVEPDVEAARDDALRVAHVTALRTVIGKAEDGSGASSSGVVAEARVALAELASWLPWGWRDSEA